MSAGTALLTLSAMVFFASNSLLCRAALGGGLCDATSFTTLRLAGGAVVLALLVRARGRPNNPRRDGRLLAAAALFGYAIGFSLAYLRIPAGTGALLLFGTVQVSLLGAGLATGERPRVQEWMGLGLSIVGLLALTAPGLAQPDPLGALLMAGAGVSWAVYTWCGRGVTDAVAATAFNFAAGLPLALVASGVAWLAGRGDTPLAPGYALHVSGAGVGLALASGAVASGLGYVIWYASLRRLTATQASLVQLSVPPLAALGGVALLGEALTPRLALASATILGGIALAVTARQKARR